MNTIRSQERPDHLERSREAILNLGYDFIAFKSNLKRGLTTLKNKTSKKNRS